MLVAAAATELSDWDREIWSYFAATIAGTTQYRDLATDPALPEDYRQQALLALRGPRISLAGQDS